MNFQLKEKKKVHKIFLILPLIIGLAGCDQNEGYRRLTSAEQIEQSQTEATTSGITNTQQNKDRVANARTELEIIKINLETEKVQAQIDELKIKVAKEENEAIVSVVKDPKLFNDWKPATVNSNSSYSGTVNTLSNTVSGFHYVCGLTTSCTQVQTN